MIVEGSEGLTHLELILPLVLEEIRRENVKLQNLNYTTIAREARATESRSFPGKTIPQISALIRSAVKK